MLLANLEEARAVIAGLEALGIPMEKVTAELEAEGVRSFSDAFAAMLAAIESRRSAAAAALGPLSAPVARRLARLVADGVPARLWSHDPNLWTGDPQGQEELLKRLGWLDLPRSSRSALKEIHDFAARARADRLTHTLLLGMGGSSLGPEVMSLVFASAPGGDAMGKREFAILDSTDPAQVLETAERFPPDRTLYLVSSKSGGTAEVNAALEYFWARTGQDGRHFAAITDPGTALDSLANARGFRATFLADPSVGGRFSALTHFGLVPAALIGLDPGRLLDRAEWMMRQCAADVSGARNPGLVLGAILAQAVASGRDKLTFLADDSVAPLGAWLEQLIAESSGKLGKGIVVVDGEPAAGPAAYGKDRLFVYLRREGKLDGEVEQLRSAGHPAISLDIPDAYDLGAEFYRWEAATAIACAELRVNAFDQPDVQDNKARTAKKIDAYSQSGKLEEAMALWEEDGLRAYSTLKLKGKGLKKALAGLLAACGRKDYVAINAYLPRNAAMTAALTELRLAVRAKTGCATTVGFGPRFLHSTGQLHKGGPETGVFLQITAEPVKDLEIPGGKMTFGVLERFQALGDYEALEARGRRILRIHLPSPAAVGRIVGAI
jgi:transaldolase/glucose-6-phosphate isomerase